MHLIRVSHCLRDQHHGTDSPNLCKLKALHRQAHAAVKKGTPDTRLEAWLAAHSTLSQSEIQAAQHELDLEDEDSADDS